MAKGQMVLTVTLMITSLLLFVSSFVWMIRNKKAPEKYNKAGVSTALAFSGFLLLSIWLLRFAIGYFAIAVSNGGTAQLTTLEEIVNSLFRTLRTFSMEEEYADYIISIKALIAEIVPNTHWSFSLIHIVAIVYASVLNLIAPIIGGAIILEILASIFPKIGLRWSYFFIKRPKYFFSELNPASLSLAKSIYNKEKSEKPILIFTDTYVDDEKEKEYELLIEAKKYGAICIRDDLVHVKKSKYGKRSYFLMDENEFGNLQTLMGLTKDHNVKYIRDACIYLFVQSDAYVQVEKQINKEFEKEEKKKLFKGGEKPTIVPVNGYRNLVQNLFVDIPLYEPLINKNDNTRLNVTILGNGDIGTEAFLNAYWFGQMMISHDDNGKRSMSECEMTINVVSKDSEEVFWSKIDYVNPEIKGTVEVLGNCIGSSKNELLCYDRKGHKNNPYCRVRYVQADVKVGGFWNSASEKTQQLLDSDYFVVALGNDADNISIADKLRRAIGQKHIEGFGKADNTVIAYAVFNSEIAAKLNGDNYHQTKSSGQSDIYMYAFGSLDSVYSCDNIYMSRYKLLAETIGASYNQSHIQKRLQADNDGRKNSSNDNYSYWANLARAMHIKYKAFSLGLIDESVFDYPSDKFDAYKSYIIKQCVKYIRIASAESPKEFDDEMLTVYMDAQLKKHRLAWLEHRRWNAFTRTMGYQHTSAEKLFNIKNSQKDMELKLHSCLVEARLPHLVEGDTYMFADFTEKRLDDLDRLDCVSYERKKHNPYETVDYKEYDYYKHDVHGYSDASEVDQLLKFIEIS